jgi:putative ABC transport system permease protein
VHSLNIRAGVRRLFRLPLRTAPLARADADEELHAYLRDRIEQLVARGMAPEAAHAEAVRRLGGSVDQIREQLRRSAVHREEHMRLSQFVDDLRLDGRYAVRALTRRPRFTAVAVLTTALGIGASTAIFSAARPILFSPVPYPDAGRVVVVEETLGPEAGDRLGWATFDDVRARTRTLAAVAALGSWEPTLTGNGQPAILEGQRVTAQYFRVLGVHPALGRDFIEADDRPGAGRAVILSDPLWRSRFAADTSLVGRTITLSDNPYTVIGVLPAGFEDVLQPAAQVWRPLQYDATLPYACRSCRHLQAVARVRPDGDARAAAGDMNAILRQLAAEHPGDYPQGTGGTTVPLGARVTGTVRPAMLAAFGAVLLVLLISCVNVANLLLGRLSERRGELAVRAALGAGRGRLVRQLLAESALLGAAGGALGLALAWPFTRLMVRIAPPSLPRVQAMHVNGAVLAFALLATATVALAFGLLPALQAARGSMQADLQGASRRTTVGSRGARSVLVAAEVALAVVVLAGSGLLLRSMARLFEVRPGFDAGGVLTLQVQLNGHRFDNDTVAWRYYDDLLERVRAVPGVAAAALTSQLPLSGDFDANGVHLERHPRPDPEDDPSAHRYAVSAGYLEAMRIPVLRGRTLTPQDRGGTVPVLLVNQEFARKYFPGEDPIGQRVRVGAAASGPWWTIVGVTGDVHQVTLAGSASDALYLPESQWMFADGAMWLVVRSRTDRAALASAVRQAIWASDPNQPIVRVATMDAVVRSSAGGRRFLVTLFAAFAAIAVALAALGLYGVLAASVAERVREIGVREALGATPGDMVRMIVRQGVAHAAIGAAVGVALAFAGSRAIADQLFGISSADPVTYGGVVVLVLVVSLAACAVPARRAARLDPVLALRAE